jgi:hypothetical protein
MARETILIGCRLPNGLILHHPDSTKNVTVKLEGTLRPPTADGLYLPAKMFATTEVDAEFWALWKAAYVGFPPLKNRAVFEARSDQEATGKAKEVAKEKTGFEQMPRTLTVDGVKLEQSTT